MNAVGITDKIKHDPRKFEIWYHGREDVYTVTAPSANTKQEWVKEIKHVLESQPKSSVTPPNPYSAGKIRKQSFIVVSLYYGAECLVL